MTPAPLSNSSPINTTDSVTRMWKCNDSPFDCEQSETWTACSADISVDDTHRQHPIQPCVLPNGDDDDTDWRRERFAFKLEPQVSNDISTNTSDDDVKYYGSRFIADWLLYFADGNLKVKFDAIFPVLLNGIRAEGYLNNVSEHKIKWYIDQLDDVRAKVKKKKEVKCMKYLSKCCAKLYTKSCFLFRLVNKTLRDDDRTKLHTLGPYCYLTYNYTNHYAHDFLSVRQRLCQTHSPPLLLYRGDHVPEQKLVEYQQATKQRDKCFKWLSFASTSCKRDVGEIFGTNILYVIDLKGAASYDQFVDLRDNTFMPHEEEVLLRPGVRFRVKSVTFDSKTNLQVVCIKIVPSYISYLR